MKNRRQKHNNLYNNSDDKGSTILAIHWIIISTGLWLIIPQQFTQTDGPGGVITMLVVGIIGLILAMFTSSLFQSSKK